MKKCCFSVAFENCSLGYVLADTWAEAVQEVQQVRKKKYPEMSDGEEDIVEIKLLGDSIYNAP